MKISKMIGRIILFMTLFTAIVSPKTVKAQVSLTLEEKDYIQKGNIIKAVSLHGGAPIQYVDAQGQVKGISKEVLELIADMTGLIFEYQLYDTVEEVYYSGGDIVFGIPDTYVPDNMVLSLPYLKSETILFINSSVDINDLDDKIYAATKGSDLPNEIKEEKAIYYETREASLKAVDRGQADYGYGNAYSVVYYGLRNNYKI